MSTAANRFADVIVVSGTEARTSAPEAGLQRKVLAYNDQLFLAEHRMQKGWSGAVHSHPHEQIVYIVQGHLRITASDREFEVRSGDSFVVRGGIAHGATALEDSIVIDVFTPCREDYL